LLPRLPFFLPFETLFAHFFNNIPSHCHKIHSAIMKFSKGSQASKVSQKSASAFFLYSGPSRRCFKEFCSWIMDWCFSPETQPPILSSTCWRHYSWAAPSFWPIASKKIPFDLSWFGLCLQPHPRPTNRHSHKLYRIHHRQSQVMEANWQSLQHLSSTIPQTA
jgi:hypothetical protein